jgi:hypothetical protein
VLFDDMQARRRVVLAAKGQALPSDADADVVMAGVVAEAESMSVASGVDIFAQVGVVKRERVHPATAVCDTRRSSSLQPVVRSSSPGDTTLPNGNPVLPSTMRFNSAKAKAAAAAVTNGSAALPSSGVLAEMLHPGATVEPLPTDFSFASKVTWFFIKAGISPLRATQAVCEYVVAKGGIFRPKISAAAAGGFRVKLQVSFGGVLKWDVKVFDVSLAAAQGSCVPSGAGLLVEVHRNDGDSLGSKIEFSKLAHALSDIIEPVSAEAISLLVSRADASVGKAAGAGALSGANAEAGAAVKKAASSGSTQLDSSSAFELTTRSPSTFASDILQLI